MCLLECPGTGNPHHHTQRHLIRGEVERHATPAARCVSMWVLHNRRPCTRRNGHKPALDVHRRAGTTHVVQVCHCCGAASQPAPFNSCRTAILLSCSIQTTNQACSTTDHTCPHCQHGWMVAAGMPPNPACTRHMSGDAAHARHTGETDHAASRGRAPSRRPAAPVNSTT
jgi:hypothetical protein